MSSFIKKDNVLIYSYSYIYQDSIGSNLIIIFKDPVVFKEVTRIHNFHVAVNTVLLRLSDQIKAITHLIITHIHVLLCLRTKLYTTLRVFLNL